MLKIEIKPTEKQELFLSSEADIVIFGGGAGGGKTYALLFEGLRHIENKNFGAVIFRRTSPQITNEGGLWDESMKLYPMFAAKPKTSPNHTWTFPKGAKIAFAHLQHDKTVHDWQGSQVPLIAYDELTHFSEYQFFYMLSRNRSTCGIEPYIRATCNPDVDSWVAKFIAWWINQETGFPIAERAGKIRWFSRVNNEMYWSSEKGKLLAKFPKIPPKSVTFIPATLYDNEHLLKANPQYEANLYALPLVERERLLGGNWKIRLEAGKFFNRSWFEVVEVVPRPLEKEKPIDCRFWDFASTEKKITGNNPDFTAGVLIRFFPKQKLFCVLDVVAFQGNPATVEKQFFQTAKLDKARAERDNVSLKIRWEIEGGSAGKRESYRLTSDLIGYDAKGVIDKRDKLTRAKAFAVQSEAGNVKVLARDWTENFLNHLHGQPDLDHDDIMDGSSGAFNVLHSEKGWSGSY